MFPVKPWGHRRHLDLAVLLLVTLTIIPASQSIGNDTKQLQTSSRKRRTLQKELGVTSQQLPQQHQHDRQLHSKSSKSKSSKGHKSSKHSKSKAGKSEDAKSKAGKSSKSKSGKSMKGKSSESTSKSHKSGKSESEHSMKIHEGSYSTLEDDDFSNETNNGNGIQSNGQSTLEFEGAANQTAAKLLPGGQSESMMDQSTIEMELLYDATFSHNNGTYNGTGGSYLPGVSSYTEDGDNDSSTTKDIVTLTQETEKIGTALNMDAVERIEENAVSVEVLADEDGNDFEESEEAIE